MTRNKKSLVFKISFSISNFFLCLASCFLLCQTKDYRIDHLSYEIVDYNKNRYDDSYFKNPILSVHCNSDNQNDLHSMYTDTQHEQYSRDSRIITDSAEKITLFDNFDCNNDIYFLFQNHFSSYERKTFDGQKMYLLDYGKFYTYFSSNLDKGECDFFVVISDDYADYLLYQFNKISADDLSLDQKKDFYKEKLLGKILKTSRNYSYKISNIASTKYLSGPTMNDVYSNSFFGLCYFQTQLRYVSEMPIHFEADLKANPYGNKKIMTSICNTYSGIERYDIKLFDSSKKQYALDTQLSSKTNEVLKSSSNIWFVIPCVCILLFSILFSITMSFLNKNAFFSIPYLLLHLVVLLIVGIVCSFVYVYSYSTIIWMIFVVNALVLERKGVSSYVKRIVNRSVGREKKVPKSFIEIKI